LARRLSCRGPAWGSLWFCVTLMVLAGPLLRTANGQARPSPGDSVVSHTGQFIVHAERSPRLAMIVSNLGTNRNLIRLEPAPVGVSGERIKQILLRELGASASWRGRIYVELRPAHAANQTITITSERFKDGWQYQLLLPDFVERDRYARAIVQVLLLEFANRGSHGRLAEIPLWLTEGLSQRLLASSELEIILPPPRETVNGLNVSATRMTGLMDDPVAQARKRLRGHPPVTFDQLSWQAEDELSGAAAGLYRASAQLFVSELLRLREGRICLRTMLTRLSQYYNWQLAFLDAFRGQFERPLDVEKWWALCGVKSPERDLAPNRPAEESWQTLDDALRSAAPARAGATAQAAPADVTLQTIIREWNRAQQTQALQARIQELSLLRPRLSPDLALLVQEYCQALEAYLRNQHWTKPIIPFAGGTHLSRVAQETIQRLDALDARREALRPAKEPLPSGQVTAQPVPSP
jgi:hypothetical protein